MNRLVLIFRHALLPGRTAANTAEWRWLLMFLLMLAPLAGFGQVTMGTTFGGCKTGFGWLIQDPNIAVGPNHVCEVVNTGLIIYTKSGQLIAAKSLSAIGGAGIDPTIVFDTTVNRWVVCSGLKSVYFSVSDTSDPTEGWSEFHTISFPGANDGGRFGFNASAYFLTYPDNPNTVIIDKASLLDKDNSTFIWYRWHAIGNKTLMMDDAVDATPGNPMWFYSGANLYKVTNYLTGTPGGLATPTVQTIPVTGGTIQGSKYAVIRNGKMTCIRDYGTMNWSVTDIATATVVQSGTLLPPAGYASPRYTYISQTPSGDIGVVFDANSSDGSRIGMFVTGRAPTDPPNTMRPPVLVSSGTYAGARLGDYSSVFEDPVDGTFWAVNQTDNDWNVTMITNFGISNVPAAPLQQVSGFGIRPSDGTNVNVQWGAVPGATNYKLMRSTNGLKFTTVADLPSGTTSYNDTPAAPVSQYYYEIIASNGQTTSGAPAVVRVVLAPAPPTFNALPAPANLVASLGAGNAVQLNWSDISGETGYVIERSYSGVTWTQIGTTATGVAQYTDSNPGGPLLYFYRVSASGSGGTKSVPSTVAYISNRPSTPSVSVAVVGNAHLQLRWNDMPRATGFTISRSTNGVDYTVVATVPANYDRYTDIGLTPMTTYYYRVVANGVVGDSLPGTASGMPRLKPSAVTVTQGTNQLSVTWSAVSGANNYLLQRSTDNVNFTTIATQAARTFADTTASQLVQYYYRVIANDTATGSTSVPSASDFGVVRGTVPAGWMAQDIGVSGVGAAGFNSNTYTVFGCGADIWGTSDQFHYAYQSMVGDGTIIARVATQQNTGAWAKAGVMIRETTAANSAHAIMALTPGQGTPFMWRGATGGSTSNYNTTGLVAPYWVKLVRSGNTFTGYRSSNGTTWTQQGSPVLIPMAASVKIGLAVSSYNSNALCKVTFDNVSVLAAVADMLAVNPGAAGTVNVLANDLAASGSTLTVTAVTQGSKGTVVNNGNGTVTYTSNPGAIGRDSFTYTMNDGQGNAATGMVSVSINGVQAYFKLDEGSGTITADATDSGFTGALSGATWTTGVAGTGGLAFSGTDSGVSIPALNLNSNTVTISGWVKRNGTQPIYSGIVATRFGSSVLCGLIFGSANELRYSWNGANYTWNSGLVPPDGQWTFVALVVTPTNAKIYMQPLGGSMTSATNNVANAAAAYNGVTAIGRDPVDSARIFKGSMDEVRIYNTSLSAAEAASLAKATPSVATAVAASPNPVTGTTSSLSALGASNFHDESSLTYTWAATSLPAGASAPTFSTNGTNAAKNATATFSQAGNYTLQVTISDPAAGTVTSSVNLTVNQTLTSVTVSPASVGLVSNGSQQFTALGRDQFGNPLTAQPAFAWGKIGAGSVNTSGLYTASYSSGAAVVSATTGALNASANVTVTNAAPTVATAASASPSIVSGTSTNLSVLGADSDGGGEANLNYTWTASTIPSGATPPTYSANGTNTAMNATATFTSNGNYTFTVTIADSGGLSVTSTVNVTVSTVANGIWTNVGGGSWPNSGNWSGGIVGNGLGSTADFNSLNLTANATVTLEGSRLLGNLTFGDTTPSHNWTLNSGGPLTLDVGTGTPTITVNNQTATIDSVIAGTKGLSKSGAGTLVLSGANTYTGGITLNGGVLHLGGASGAAMSGDLTIAAGANGYTQGVYLLTDQTSGVLHFNSTNWNYVRTNGRNWTVAGLDNPTGTSNNGVIENGGYNKNVSTSGTLNVNVASGASHTYAGFMRNADAGGGTGILNLVKTGAGSQTLKGASIVHTGSTSVNAGTLILTPSDADWTLPIGTKSIASGATLKVDLSPQATQYRQTNLGSTAINAGGVLELYGTADNVNSHYLINAWTASGAGTIRVAGGGSIANWTGSSNSLSGFTGLLDIQNGRFAVNVGSASTLGGTLDVNVASTGKLDLRSGHFTIDALNGVAGGLVHKSYTGDTISFTIGNGNGSGAFAGVMSGTNYNVIKTGTGTQVLAGANTYTGSTTINGGTLLINGSLANTATTVATAGKLGGTGTLAGAVTNNGTLAPGNSGIGNLTVNNIVTAAPGSSIAWEISNWTGAAGTGWDKLTANSLNLTATSANPVTIRISEVSLTNFAETSQTFTLIQTTGGITGFSADKFVIDASALTTPQGTWAIQQSGNNLVLAYTVSESMAASPSSINQAASFMIADGSTASGVATSSSDNDGVPVFTADPILAGDATAGSAYTGQTLAGSATDAGDTITYSKVSGPEWLVIAANGDLTGTPPAGSARLESFVVRATDSTSATDEAELRIQVLGLPLPWTSADIGIGMLAGNASYSANTFTQAGSGTLGGTGDKLRYVYQTLNGDGEIIARISSQHDTVSEARIGVMIRESLAANSRQAFMGLSGSGTSCSALRADIGGFNTTITTGTAPNTWVRLVRSGDTVAAYESGDGISWTPVGSATVTMATNCYIGLAVSSGSDATLNTSQFSNVSATP